MVLSIDATQDARSQAAFVRPIILLTLTVHQPSSTVYRFSTGYRTYGGNEYLDYLMGVSGIMQTMVHMGSPPIPDAVTVRLLNGPYGSGTLLDSLLSKTIENASVTIEELLLASAESRSVPTSATPTTRFVGRVKRISKIEDQDFAIECLDERVALDDAIGWYTVAEADGAPPYEVNKRLPKVYGDNVLVPMIAWDVGSLTTLAQDITESTTGAVKFTNVTGFASSGSIILGAEKVSYSSKSDANQTLTLSARGVSGGGAAVIHKTGESVVELQTNNYWIANDGANTKAVTKVFFKSPGSGQLVDITTLATISLTDTSRVSGRTVASVNLTSADIELLKQLDNTIQQADYGPGIVEMNFDENFTTILWTPPSNDAWRTLGWGTNPLNSPITSWDTSTGFLNELRRFLVFGKSTTTQITRFRIGLSAQVEGGVSAFSPTLYADVFGPSGETAGVSINWSTSEVNGVVTLKTAQSSWTTVTNQPQTLNDLVNAGLSTGSPYLRLRAKTNGWPNTTYDGSVKINVVRVFVEFETASTRTADAASYSPAFGLEFFAEVDGYKVPTSDTTYSVSAGTLIEKDYDIARHILQVAAGQSSATLASDWNTQGAIETTNSQHGFDLRTLGSKLSEVLGELGNESRANLPFEAGLWRFLRRPVAGYTPVTGLIFSKTNALGSFDPSIKGIDDLYNTCAGWYNLDPGIDGGEDSQFKGRVTAVDAAAVTAYGKRELAPYRFRTILLSAVAQATLDELLTELKDRRYTLGWSAPYYEHFTLQLGDVVLVQLPFLASTIGVRILEIIRNVQDGSATIKGCQIILA